RRGGEPFRVVLDTNILVASFFRGSSRQVVGLWLGGELTLCLSPAIRREYDSVLAHFAFRKEQAAAIREGLEGGRLAGAGGEPRSQSGGGGRRPQRRQIHRMRPRGRCLTPHLFR
ncbi:MAG: PIN domain-containing protein, partial [Akkermansiaceae bacterium]|nr:PIN domain-containing protein [Akkermansiaceae bacterium]NIT79240.1 PIN domain-containing protein [Thermoplasmata archaeon]NIY05608.1 PIN domain-containing protein [Thermoplasmata archaeon]